MRLKKCERKQEGGKRALQKRPIFCKRDLYFEMVYRWREAERENIIVDFLRIQVTFAKEPYKNDLYYAKETYIFMEPTSCSHPIKGVPHKRGNVSLLSHNFFFPLPFIPYKKISPHKRGISPFLSPFQWNIVLFLIRFMALLIEYRPLFFDKTLVTLMNGGFGVCGNVPFLAEYKALLMEYRALLIQ